SRCRFLLVVIPSLPRKQSLLQNMVRVLVMRGNYVGFSIFVKKSVGAIVGSLKGADGVGRSASPIGREQFAELTTPSAPPRWLRDFLLPAQPPLLFKEGKRSSKNSKDSTAVGTICFLVCMLCAAPAHAQSPAPGKTVLDGVFSETQAKRGQAAYAAHCSVC